MSSHALVRLLVAACLGLAALSATAADDLEGVLGGMRYDKWWVAAGLAAPQGNHPLYPAFGQQSGATTWRCKECHGWDYKGVDGAYASGSHFTGIRGVFGSTMPRMAMFDLLKNGHGYQNSGMSDEDYWYLVEFLQGYLLDTSVYVDANRAFIGDATEGRHNYRAVGGYYACANCHGEDPADIRQIANDNPWEFLHKVQFSDAGGPMASWILGGGAPQGAADIGRYLQAGLPGPEYVGDQSCIVCHADDPSPGFFDGYKRSGHPWKIYRAAGQEPAPDTWPYTPVPPLPVVFGAPLQWSGVEYVIGNYFWKTRFIDRSGYIYTGAVGEKTQWNLATHRWVGYNAGVVNKPFDCGECHTTGFRTGGNQHGLPGLRGTWAEDGVRCEACHGPAADHVRWPSEMLPPGGKDCAECHYRDAQMRMPWKSGFMEHHQQAEDFAHSPHGSRMTCVECHNPHRSTVYGDGGVTRACTSCHPGTDANNNYVVHEMEEVECIDCHMPHMGKSGDAVNAYKGDVRGHLFRIMRNPIFAVENTYQQGGGTYWKQDRFGRSSVTLDYACLGCHTQIGEPLTIQEAAAFAFNIHNRQEPPCPADLDGDGFVTGDDFQLFVEWFEDGDLRADFDGDGFLSGDDFAAFVAAFEAGC